MPVMMMMTRAQILPKDGLERKRNRRPAIRQVLMMKKVLMMLLHRLGY
jgi:hypothetical protein